MVAWETERQKSSFDAVSFSYLLSMLYVFLILKTVEVSIQLVHRMYCPAYLCQSLNISSSTSTPSSNSLGPTSSAPASSFTLTSPYASSLPSSVPASLKYSRTAVIVGTTVGGFVLVCLCLILFFCVNRRTRRRRQRLAAEREPEPFQEALNDSNPAHFAPIRTFSTIKALKRFVKF